MTGPTARPTYEPPVERETASEARQRRKRNSDAEKAWLRYEGARCGRCGMVRFHVSHEMDPETSSEGPRYHANIAHHPFVEPSR
jgi:hypothetical protein